MTIIAYDDEEDVEELRKRLQNKYQILDVYKHDIIDIVDLKNITVNQKMLLASIGKGGFKNSVAFIEIAEVEPGKLAMFTHYNVPPGLETNRFNHIVDFFENLLKAMKGR